MSVGPPGHFSGEGGGRTRRAVDAARPVSNRGSTAACNPLRVSVGPGGRREPFQWTRRESNPDYQHAKPASSR